MSVLARERRIPHRFVGAATLAVHRKCRYTRLQLSGKLNSYLSNTDQQAQYMFLQLVEQMAEHEGMTEKLKAEDQMK